MTRHPTPSSNSSSVSASVNNNRLVRTLGVNRIRNAFGSTGVTAGGNTVALGSGGASGASGALAYGEEKSRVKTAAEKAAESILVDHAVSGPVAWAEGYGGWGKSYGENGNADLSNAIGGVAFGIDTALGDTTWRSASWVAMATPPSN